MVSGIEATFTIGGMVRSFTWTAVDLGIVELVLRKKIALNKHTLIGSDGSGMPRNPFLGFLRAARHLTVGVSA